MLGGFSYLAVSSNTSLLLLLLIVVPDIGITAPSERSRRGFWRKCTTRPTTITQVIRKSPPTTIAATMISVMSGPSCLLSL